MQISLRIKLDETKNAFVVELEPGAIAAPAKDIKLGRLEEGWNPIMLQRDADGYIIGIVVPHAKEILERLDEPQVPAKPDPKART